MILLKRELKKKSDINSYDYSFFAREMTEEELYIVNGGSTVEDTHTVQSGDTLGTLVYNYNQANGTNLTVSEVAESNGIEDPNLIYVGQTINFGNSGGDTTASNSETENTLTDTSGNFSQQQQQGHITLGGSAQTSVTEPTSNTANTSVSTNSSYSGPGSSTVDSQQHETTMVTESEHNSSDSFSETSSGNDNHSVNNNSNNSMEITPKYVDQKTVGRDLGLPEDKTCLLTDWIIAYMNAGLSYERCIKVIKDEISNGNILSEDSNMENQLATSKALAKELKGESYDNLYLQYPWIKGKQVLFYNEEDFYNSDYPYGIGKYSGVPEAEDPHYEFYYNNPDMKLDPWPGGEENCPNFSNNSLDVIKPLGWYP